MQKNYNETGLRLPFWNTTVVGVETALSYDDVVVWKPAPHVNTYAVHCKYEKEAYYLFWGTITIYSSRLKHWFKVSICVKRQRKVLATKSFESFHEEENRSTRWLTVSKIRYLRPLWRCCCCKFNPCRSLIVCQIAWKGNRN